MTKILYLPTGSYLMFRSIIADDESWDLNGKRSPEFELINRDQYTSLGFCKYTEKEIIPAIVMLCNKSKFNNLSKFCKYNEISLPAILEHFELVKDVKEKKNDRPKKVLHKKER